MKLLPLIWLLSGLLLVAGQQNASAAASPKDIVAGKGVPGSESGTPPVAGQAQPKEPVVQKPKEDTDKTAQAEGVDKHRKRTDTSVPPASNSTVEQKGSKGNKTATPNSAVTSTSTTTTTTAKPAAGSAIVSDGQSMRDVTKAGSSPNSTATSSSTTTTTTTTKPTTTSTTTTTPKPKKPTLTESMNTHPELESELEQQKSQEKPGQPTKPTQAQPSEPLVQELTGSSHREQSGYVVPILTVLLTVPLAIGVMTILYRRFRDMWSTRHYRRMDFLVDGMYND
ncbi:salivary glue protein Sgs-3 [Drosophila rhopaloa]|uniref:Salivary glue protein Sgs-3 n=1 Tax=Drosophila rhopaloa TaxID=1041015 RepID=A0A6P4EPQ5_DRORH|nr:salivary glue protein Sgs-3 [Drosophila rhopaloa]